MGEFKSTIIQFEGKPQAVEDLINRARFYAQSNRSYSLEIILHLQDHAHQYNDSALFDLCRELMMFVQSPSPYTANNSKQSPADINNLPNQQFRELTWEEEKQCFKAAVLSVMKIKKKSGGYLFDKNTHWIAVYRYAVDTEIMYDDNDPKVPKDKSTTQYKNFENFAKELQLHITPLTRLPFKYSNIENMNKDTYSRYNKPRPWSNDGLKGKSLTLFKELDTIYSMLEKYFGGHIDKASRITI